jgi:hypothetical protein
MRAEFERASSTVAPGRVSRQLAQKTAGILRDTCGWLILEDYLD